MTFLVPFLLIQGAFLVYCQEPQILGGSESVIAIEGTDALLRCQVRNLGIYKQSWFRTNPVDALTRGEEQMTPGSRYHLIDTNEWVLQIDNVVPSDSGLYECQINTLEKPTFIVNLTVVVPAEIVGIEPLEIVNLDNEDPKKRIFNESDPAQLFCVTNGTPKPIVTWIRHDADLNIGRPSEETDTLYFDSINRDDAGIYECTADNQYGNQDAEEIELVVQYKPSITASEDDLRLGAGSKAILRCIVHSNPPATFTWLKGNTALRGFSVEGPRSEYIIDSVIPNEHFGEYTCIANNIIGTARHTIKLSGQPTSPVIVSSSVGMIRHEYKLVWQRPNQGGAPITQYKILYKRLKEDEDINVTVMSEVWEEVIHIPIDGSIVLQKTLHNLHQSSTYDLKMWAINSYGDGDNTVFRFTTPDVDMTTITPDGSSTKKDGDHKDTTKNMNPSTEGKKDKPVNSTSQVTFSLVTMVTLMLFLYSFL